MRLCHTHSFRFRSILGTPILRFPGLVGNLDILLKFSSFSSIFRIHRLLLVNALVKRFLFFLWSGILDMKLMEIRSNAHHAMPVQYFRWFQGWEDLSSAYVLSILLPNLIVLGVNETSKLHFERYSHFLPNHLSSQVSPYTSLVDFLPSQARMVSGEINN